MIQRDFFVYRYSTTQNVVDKDELGKGHLEEINVKVKDDTHLVIEKTLIANSDADASISEVYVIY